MTTPVHFDLDDWERKVTALRERVRAEALACPGANIAYVEAQHRLGVASMPLRRCFLELLNQGVDGDVIAAAFGMAVAGVLNSAQAMFDPAGAVAMLGKFFDSFERMQAGAASGFSHGRVEVAAVTGGNA